MDYSAISEEIALEGLDGITLNALWKRLESRPDFADVNIDDDFKQFIWKYACHVKDFTFYCLPESRPELVIFKYSNYIINGACKCLLPNEIPPDIYSHKVVDQDGIKGCCDNYESRKNVIEEVRNSDGSPLISLQEVIERWGQSFVIVASQRQRNLVLMGSTSCPVTMGVEIYCILEAVGRSRYDGEVTHTKHGRGLSNLKISESGKSTNVFAAVKTLAKYGYIRKQPFTLKYQAPGSNVQVRLIHLRKFYKATMANLRGYLTVLNNHLMSKPKHMALFTDVVKLLKLNFSLFKKTNRFLHEHFATDVVEISELPDASNFKTKKGISKKVKVVKLLKPYRDEDIDDEDDDDDEDGDEFEDGDESKMDVDTGDDKLEDLDKELGKKKPDFGNLSLTQTVMQQAIRHVVESGDKGLLQRQLLYKLNMEKNAVRCCVKELLKVKSIAIVKRAQGKNNAHILVSNEVVEAMGKTKIMNDATMSEPVADMDIVKTLPESEEAESRPSEEQPLIIHVQEMEFDLNNVSVICTIDRAEHPSKSLAEKEENDRKLARKKFILKTLSERKVFGYSKILFDEMCDEEKSHGVKEQMCRKSFKRILKELYNEGHIAYVNIRDKRKPEKVLYQMLIDPRISLQDSKVHEALVLSSLRFVRLDTKASHASAEKKLHPSSGEPEEGASSSPSAEKTDSIAASDSEAFSNKRPVACSMVSVCQMLDRSKKSKEDKQSDDDDKSKRGVYCQIPKFERARQLHIYLYYLLYGYEGSLNVPSQDDLKQGSSDAPLVYLDVDDWRRHVPPLKKHNESFLTGVPMAGVCMTGDILLNMPLVLFCNVISIPWKVKGLSDLLKDPVRKHYPITCAPQPILSRLTKRRIYLQKLHESLIKLCHMGLLSFGTKTGSRELEFISFYLHKKAMVLDTRNSQPGSNMTRCPEGETFPKLHYSFNAMSDVVNYWNDIKIIGLNSKLGSYSMDDEKGDHGTVTLHEAAQHIPLQEVNEDDWLPGDRRGAVGFDTSLFAHRNNNWTVKANRGQHKSTVAILSAESKESESLMQNADEVANSIQEQEEPPVKKRKVVKAAPSSFGMGKLLKKNVKRRKPMKRKDKPATKKEKLSTIMDDIDKQAKLNMRRQRSYFTPLENGLLLLSQIASCMLSPRSGFCVKSTVIRDILQEFYPEAKDKTACAVKGKMARLLKEEKFRIHLVTYMSQAISDKTLMEKYKGKRPTIHSPEMEKLFWQLYRDLWKKFSSPSSESPYMPSSLAELESEYEVKYTMDLLFKSPKVTKDVQCVSDAREVVLWELLESFLHLTNSLARGDVYYTLSRFPDEIIHRVFTNLKSCAVFIQMKKPEKDKLQIVNRSALLNNHRSTSRHKDALKPRYPVDLFWNLKLQIESLIKMKPAEPTSSSDGNNETNMVLPGAAKQSPESTEPSGNHHTPMDGTEPSRNHHTPMDGIEPSGNHHTPMDGIEPSGNHHTPMETEPQTKKSEHGASSVDAQLRETVVEKLAVQHDPQGNCEVDVSDENSLETSFEKLQLHKYHGGTVLTVLSLLAMDLLKVKVVIPDEMVKLDEDGKKKLYFKKPTNTQQLKRKHNFGDSDEEADAWQPAEMDTTTYQHRSGQRQRGGCTRGLKYPRSEPKTMKKVNFSVIEPSSNSGVREIEKCVELKDVTLKMRVLNTAASDVLENFTVWVASGSLLTIARTSLIESLDLLNSKCLLQRNFIVEPLGIDCALKPKAFHRPESGKNRTEKNLVPATKRSRLHDEAARGSESFDSAGQKSSSHVTVESVAMDNPNSSSSNKNARSWFPEDFYLDLIRHLEKCFNPEMFSNDIRQQLQEIIPAESLDRGLSLFDAIDSSGDLGITEVDLEHKVSATICQMKSLLRILIWADAIFTVGSIQRRYVSRKHAKVWFVEVPAPKASDAAGAEAQAPTARRESIVYQCHLWRHLSGRLNWEGLQTILQRILTFLMANPGYSLHKLCHMLNPDILPATTMEAVEILEEVGCVNMRRLQKPAQCSLFSSRRRGLAMGDNVRAEECITVIDVLVEAPIKLAYFLDFAVQYCQRK